MSKPMNSKDISEYKKSIPKWRIVKNKLIERDFKFNNFKHAIDFVNAVANIAENERHHPNIFIYAYNNVRITLSTHTINSLSKCDFIEAVKIDKLFEEFFE